MPPWLNNFLVAALAGSLYGYDVGGVSSVLTLLTDSADLGTLSTLQLGCVASGSLFGAMGASALLIGIGDAQLGRVWELRIAASMYIAGTVVQSSSPTFAVLLTGRVLYGLGIGTAMHVAPLYIAETVPTSLRGALVSMKEAAIVGGMVLGYVAGSSIGAVWGWRGVFAAAAVLALPMLALSLIVPESPRWLVRQGRSGEAILIVVKCQDVDLAEAQVLVKDMEDLVQVQVEPPSLVGRLEKLVSTAANRRALTVALGLVLFQQFSGQPSVLYYASTIFEDAGIGAQASIGVGLFKLFMTLVSVRLVEDERCGRRPLLMIGTTGMAASAATLGVLYSVAGTGTPSSAAVIGCVLGFVGFYQIGFGPITWLIISEVFPGEIRASAISTATLTNFSANFLVTLLFDYEREAVGNAILFWQFAAIAAVGVAFEARYVPETRGLSLEEIERQLVENNRDED